MSDAQAWSPTDRRYRDEAAARRVRQQYRSMLELLDRPIERRWVDTAAGVTHVLTAGDEAAEPLVVFHGGNAINPMTLPWLLPLADEYHLIAPDTIGHPGFSAPTRLDPSTDAYGRWAIDVLDALAIDSARMVGLSYGAGIILKTAAVAPTRIERAGLIVPAGFGSTSRLRLLARMAVPLVRYRLIPTRRNLLRAIEPLCHDPETTLDPATLDTLEVLLSGMRPETELPSPVTRSELADFEAPTFVAVATDDLLFPPEVVLPRAHEVISNLEVVMRLEGEAHMPSPEARETMLRYLRPFLTGASKYP